eukprot:gene36076-44492_t
MGDEEHDALLMDLSHMTLLDEDCGDDRQDEVRGDEETDEFGGDLFLLDLSHGSLEVSESTESERKPAKRTGGTSVRRTFQTSTARVTVKAEEVDQSESRGRGRTPHARGRMSLADHCYHAVYSKDPDTRLTSLDYILTQLESVTSPALNVRMLEINVPKALLDLLLVESNVTLAHKSLAVLAKISLRCSCPQMRRFMQMVSVPQLVKLLTSDSVVGLHDQLIHLLQCIAVKGEQFREQGFSAGILSAVIEALKRKPILPVYQSCTKLLRALTAGGVLGDGHHSADIQTVVAILSALLHTDTVVGGSECVHSACAMLSELLEREDAQSFSTVFFHSDGAILRKLVQIANVSPSSSRDFQCCAIDTLSHLALGPHHFHQALIDAGLLSAIHGVIQDTADPQLVSAACRCASYITTGDCRAIQTVIDAGLFLLLINLVETAADPKVRLHASYAVLFAFRGADLNQTKYLVNEGAAHLLVDMLCVGAGEERGVSFTVLVLAALKLVLSKYHDTVDFNHVVGLIESSGGWESVRCLRDSQDGKIRKLALSLDVFWAV